MIQTLLADRFKLVLRRETKEMPVYLLTVGKGGFKSNGNPSWAMLNGQPIRMNGKSFGEEKMTMVRRISPPNGEPYASMGIWKMSMADFAAHLFGSTSRPVLDRTGLSGTFDFHLEYDNNGTSRPSIVKAVEDVGLKLESGRAAVEVWVIERAERPSEN
jgi:uncharacterized protein (TIGR03435 family)